jgi:hypothetical protein
VTLRPRCAALALVAVGGGACLSVPGEQYPCDPDSGNGACAPWWRCGLEGYCHDEDVGAAYLCVSDADCEQGWACGFEGQCVPPNQDPLVLHYAGPFDVQLVSPLPPASHVSKLAMSQRLLLSAPPNSVALQTVSLLDSTGTVLTEVDEVEALDLVGGGERYQPAAVGLGDTVLAVSALNGSTLTLTAGDGGWVTWWGNFDGGLQPLAQFGTSGATSLQTVYLGEIFYATVAFGPDGTGTFTVLPNLDGGPPDPQPFSVPARPLDFSLVAPVGCSPLWALSLEPGGVMVGSLGAPSQIYPVETGGTYQPRRIRTRDNLIAVEGLDSSGTPGIYLYAVSGGDGGAADAGCPALTASLQLPQNGDPACGCDPGDRIADFHIEDPTVTVSYDFRCVADAGFGANGPQYSRRAQVLQGPSSLKCENLFPGADSLWSEPSTVWQTNAPGLAGYAGSHGELWVGTAQEETERTSFLVPDLPPDVLLGHSDFLLAYNQTEAAFFGTAALTQAASGGNVGGANVGLERFGDVFAASSTSNAMAAPVAEDYTWGVLTSGWTVRYQGGPDAGFNISVVALPDQSQAYFFAPPFNAHVTQLGNGTWALTVSSMDSVYATDVTQMVENPSSTMMPSTLQLRAIPSSRNPILSLAVEADPDAGEGLIAYALTTVGLFELSGDLTSPQWTTTAVPTTADPALAVWITPEHGVRVGYATGQVLSVTGGVQVAPAVPGANGAAVIQDFAQLCGDTYGLSPAGLLRLVPSASGPTWTPFDTACAGLCLGDGGLPLGEDGLPGFVPGQLFVSQGSEQDPTEPSELYVFTRYGSVARVVGSGNGCR